MSDRRRAILFAALVAVCAVVAVVAVLAGRGGGDAPTADAAGRKVLAGARAERRPVVVYRQLDGGTGPEAGTQVAVAAVARPDGDLATRVPLSCERVAFAGGRGLCLARGKGFAVGYRAEVFGPDFRVVHALPVGGAPSRARVSPDGRYGSVTLFVTGHSYAAAGAFSTQTTLIDMATGAKVADLDQFTVTRDAQQIAAVDMNFWGVTFARDSDRFYATMATGGKTHLIRGSVRGRSAVVLHENVECPSLSPDGTRIAYKTRRPSSTQPWRLTVLDLKTMRETALTESRSVDDQVEWLDDAHVLYAINGAVWTAQSDGAGTPRRYMADAASPAVVRW